MGDFATLQVCRVSTLLTMLRLCLFGHTSELWLNSKTCNLVRELARSYCLRRGSQSPKVGSCVAVFSSFLQVIEPKIQKILEHNFLLSGVGDD